MGRRKNRRERKLPVQQLSILEPIASTSVSPYLPEMVESFGVPQNQVGKWVGLCSAIFSVFQAAFGIPWGRFSDIYGRKPAMLLGLANTMCWTLVWGFSTNLPVALTARALAGAGNGNVGIIRTTVAEMVPFKELQPRAFSLMPLVWNVGSIFGPSIGGALANPLRIPPKDRGKGTSLLERFPYSLPNIVSAAFFFVGIINGLLFLQETHESLRDRRDWGRVLGLKIKAFCRTCFIKFQILRGIRPKSQDSNEDEEGSNLLQHAESDDEESANSFDPKPKPEPPSLKEVLNRQAVINLIVYVLLAAHTMSIDTLLPVFLHRKPIGSKGSTPYSAPLKFAGGFGMENYQIGLINTCYGIAGMFVQFYVYPYLCRKYGVLFWLKVVACAFPISYFIVPFTALIPSPEVRVAAAVLVMLLKTLCAVFAFPCSTILLTNSATSLRTLGTLNGIATSLSAAGRAAGPAIAGALFSLGMDTGYVIIPWWFLGGLAVISAIPVFFLVEGEGFGGEEEGSDEEEEAEIDEEIHAAAAEGAAEAAGKPDVVPVITPRGRIELE